jgi:hypothetical protein
MKDIAAGAAHMEKAEAESRPVKRPTVPRRHPARAVLSLVAFCLLGPPVGAFVYAIGRAVLVFALGGPMELGSIPSQGMALAYPVAYFAGFVPAAVTGALVAIAVWSNGRVSLRLTSVLAVLGALAGAWYAQRGLAAKLNPGDVPYLYAGFLLISLASGAVCWWIASAFGIFGDRIEAKPGH